MSRWSGWFARKILGAIRRLHAIESDVGETRKNVVQLAEEIAQVRRDSRGLAARLGSVEAVVKEAVQTSKVLENASREQTLLSERNYEERVIDPMLRLILPLLDMADDLSVGDQRRTGGGEQRFAETVASELRQFLATFGVETFRSAAGDVFDRRSMRPGQPEFTATHKMDMTVCRTLRCGVRRGERLLRPECVVLYRFQERTSGSDASSGSEERSGTS